MPTTSPNRNLPWIATSVVALALGLAVCANAFAQHAAAPQGRVLAAAEDMRLWSFGDCDRRFQYTGTPEYKECVRVVGSAEAVEARALHVCDVSHSADRQEAERCKANYKANKAKAAQDGVAADTPAGSQPAVSEEVMRRVKAIGSAAVEEQRAAAKVTPAPASVWSRPADGRAFSRARAQGNRKWDMSPLFLLVTRLQPLAAECSGDRDERR